MVKSKRGGSNQTSWITVREGTGSIFSVSKAVCVERKWVHSASMMFITRLHVSTALAFLEATDRILKLYWSNDEQKPDQVLASADEILQAGPHATFDAE